jgi:peroxiredoxin
MSELQGLQSRIHDIRSAGAELVAISVDPVDRNREVVARLGLDYPVLSDVGRETITAYGLVHAGASIDGGDIARPATVVIGRDGRVAWRNLTENWRVRVRPDAVVAALDDLD